MDLGNTQITDAGLLHLEKLDGLTYLGLMEARITDATLIRLVEQLPRLTRLDLVACFEISDHAITTLQQQSIRGLSVLKPTSGLDTL